VKTASGSLQGNLHLQTSLQSRSCGPAGCRSNPSSPAKHKHYERLLRKFFSFCYTPNMKVALLDRDGTVIVDPPDLRVDKIEKIELFDDSISALKYLADNDFSVIYATNQAGIEEGRLTEEEFWLIHEEVLRRLSESGVNVLKTYMNGEMKRDDNTEWRKPGPKMLLQAAEDFNLDLSQLYYVGDNQSDIDAAINAGCKGGILVKTANENVESPNAIYTAPNLSDAVKYIFENS